MSGCARTCWEPGTFRRIGYSCPWISEANTRIDASEDSERTTSLNACAFCWPGSVVAELFLLLPLREETRLVRAPRLAVLDVLRHPVFLLAALASLGIVTALLFRAWAPATSDRHGVGGHEELTGQTHLQEGPEPAVPAPTLPLTENQSEERAATEALQNEALDVAQRLIAAFPNTPDAVSVMAMVHHRFGNTAEATKWFNKCLQLDSHCADAFHGMGSMALRKGDYKEAAQWLRQAISNSPDPTGSSLQLAEALMGSGDIEEAAAVLRECAGRGPGTSQLHYSLGDAYDQLGNHQEAKESYLAAVQMDPHLRPAYYRLAKVCARLGETKESDRYMDEFAERVNQAQPARIEWVQDTTDAAFSSQAVADIYTAAALVYRQYGRLQAAEEHLVKAANLVPADRVSRHELLRLYQGNQRIDDTLRILQELAEIEPENADFRLQLGSLHANSNRFDEAERAFLDAIELAPQRADAYLAAARFYAISGRKTDQAVSLAEKAVELAPTANSYLLLSAAHRSNGDAAGALAAIKQAIERDPQNNDYRRMHDLLLKTE